MEEGGHTSSTDKTFTRGVMSTSSSSGVIDSMGFLRALGLAIADDSPISCAYLHDCLQLGESRLVQTEISRDDGRRGHLERLESTINLASDVELVLVLYLDLCGRQSQP